MEPNKPKIAIVGAGVVGLTTARILQEQVPGAKVTILADKFKQDLVSTVAAGIFRPGVSFKGPTAQVTKQWVDDSWHYWQKILKTPEAAEAGVIQISSYIFSKDNPHVTRNHLIEDLVPVYRPVTDEELKLAGGTGWKYGAFYTTVLISCEKFLPWAEKAFLRDGGEIIKTKVDSLSSLTNYDLVFNCSGLGAKYLCNDHDIVPMRGQVIKVKAPWLKTAFYGDYDTYIIPGPDGVVTLGGTRQYDSYNLEVCKHDAAAIMERCVELVPGLKDAEVVGHRVGLRPHRSPVRVQPELVGGARVVHCYGHGGYGVTCAPGTAMHAVKLGLDLLKLKNKL